MQAHARVCKENKLEELEEKDDTYWNNFTVKDASLKDHMWLDLRKGVLYTQL